MKLMLTIDIGNGGMASGWELADALRRTARDVASLGNEPVSEPVSAQRIGDLNGNTVGSWHIEEDAR